MSKKHGVLSSVDRNTEVDQHVLLNALEPLARQVPNVQHKIELYNTSVKQLIYMWFFLIILTFSYHRKKEFVVNASWYIIFVL